ncbi:MAG: FMN-binding protein, partial [Bacteroidetes bacterium]|nr:FMN-binding protein [Bacteroidota bacterium]
MSLVVSLILVGLHVALKPQQDFNQRVATKTDILKAVGKSKVENVEEFYNKSIKGIILNNKGEELTEIDTDPLDVDIKKESKKSDEERMFPVFIYSSEDGAKKYILPLRGIGLWDEIWCYVAIDENFTTIAGIAFDHTAETPGLGAEIKDNAKFGESFIGKSIINDKGDYTSIQVIKGVITDPTYQVSSISGA